MESKDEHNTEVERLYIYIYIHHLLALLANPSYSSDGKRTAGRGLRGFAPFRAVLRTRERVRRCTLSRRAARNLDTAAHGGLCGVRRGVRRGAVLFCAVLHAFTRLRTAAGGRGDSGHGRPAR